MKKMANVLSAFDTLVSPQLCGFGLTVAIPTFRREKILLETLDHLLTLQVKADENFWFLIRRPLIQRKSRLALLSEMRLVKSAG